MSSPLHEMGVAALGTALARREVSSAELVEHLLTRIEAQSRLGAFLHVAADAARAQARTMDARRAAGESLGPLAGVPIAHKDIFVTQGMPSTAGSKMLAGYASPFDATVVSRLAAAGAVSLGKLNCDEFAMGSANENSAYGAVRPIRAARSASRPASPASPASSRPTACARAGAWSPSRRAWTRPGRWRARPRIAHCCSRR
jgi:aspartyl-tRNA(Asn)/glutamyl-tRNA(Gln) amidotransferase subunit A